MSEVVITENSVAKLKLKTWWHVTASMVGGCVWLTYLLLNAKHDVTMLGIENRRDHERLMSTITEIQKAKYVRGMEVEEALVMMNATTNQLSETQIRTAWREIRQRHESQ